MTYQQKSRQQVTRGLAQAGVLSRGTLRRILEVQLPSAPYRYPRLPQAATTLCEMRAVKFSRDFDLAQLDNVAKYIIQKFGKTLKIL